MTKDSANPDVFQPLPPVHDEHLHDDVMKDEKHMLEHDLEEADFEDRDDDDILPTEFINPETGEIGGPKGPEPTRFGDWSKNGRVSDF